MNLRRAFTLIEILAVIAIILILSAIIFPVAASVKQNSYRSADISHMNDLRTALALYKVDQGGYPPALLGYASVYISGTEAGNVVPADKLPNSFLYPRRIPNLDTLRPGYNREQTGAITEAVWPEKDPAPLGSPYLDLDHDGTPGETTDDDPANARQAFGPTDVVTRPLPDASYGAALGINENIDAEAGPDIDAKFYKISGYDVATVQQPGGGFRTELRYAPFWTIWGLSGGNANDDPRQLGYADPPESTIVTWNSYFRVYDGATGLPVRRKTDILLTLGGSARNVDSLDMSQKSFRYVP